MVKKVTYKIFDSAFTPFGKSASLREDNAEVEPTYFNLGFECHSINPTFFTDGHLSDATEWDVPRKIAWLLEPRALRPENYQRAEDNHELFDVILTYDKELLDALPDKARFYPFGGSSIAFDRWGMYPKSKEICMIMSEKNTTEGHKLRHEIAEHLGNWVDVYGAGVGKPFDSTFEILKDYKYCVVVENSRADYYFTEKLIDPISVGAIPLYWGCPGIDAFLSTIPFSTIKELEVAINSLYFGDTASHWRLASIEKAKKFRICEDFIFKAYPDLFDGSSS